jgi:hypothetical protein
VGRLFRARLSHTILLFPPHFLLASAARRKYAEPRRKDFADKKPAIHAAATNFPQQNPRKTELGFDPAPIWGVSASSPQHIVDLYLTCTIAGGTFNLTVTLVKRLPPWLTP